MTFGPGSARGATLIEAVVAGALLATLSLGAGALVLRSRHVARTAERSMVATLIAAGQLERLRGIPWGYPLAGGTPVVLPLASSASGTLDRNTPGHWVATDDAGREIGEAGASNAAFAVRWAVWPLVAGGPEARALEVCVFTWPAPDGAVPLICVASARVRQP